MRLGLVLGGGLLVALVLPLMNREPDLILPERHDPTHRMDERRSRDNAYFTIVAAKEMTPEGTEEAEAAVRAIRDNVYNTDRAFDAQLQNYMGVAAGPVEGPVADHLRACRGLAERYRSAVHKPFFLRLEPPHFLRDPLTEELHATGARALGYYTLLTNDAATWREGVAGVFDCVRVFRMMYPEGGQHQRERALEEHAARVLLHALGKPGARQHLRWMLETWRELDQPFPSRLGALEYFWFKVDNTLTFSPDREVGLGRQLELTLFLLDCQSWSDAILRNRAVFERLAMLPSTRHLEVTLQVPEFHRNNQIGRVFQWQLTLLREIDVQNLHYFRTLLGIALEAYADEHGDYPEQLAALEPEWVDRVPTDPTNGQPLRYQRDDGRFTLHSYGPNEQNDGGAGDDVLALAYP